MGISRVINRRTAVLGLLLVILATAGFGFAATNNVQNSRAGDGYAEISGFNINGIDYNLVSGDPTMIDSVTFVVNGGTVVPEDVHVKLVNADTTYTPCTTSNASMPATFTCDVNVAVLAADELRVIAAQ
jgi:hypothetical protein